MSIVAFSTFPAQPSTISLPNGEPAAKRQRVDEGVSSPALQLGKPRLSIESRIRDCSMAINECNQMLYKTSNRMSRIHGDIGRINGERRSKQNMIQKAQLTVCLQVLSEGSRELLQKSGELEQEKAMLEMEQAFSPNPPKPPILRRIEILRQDVPPKS